jgi:hypothetical protein
MIRGILAVIAVVAGVGLAGSAVVPLAAPAASQPEITLYVSPTGNDANTGTLDKPLATIARARDAVRQIKKDGLPTDVTVCLRGGIYTLDKTVTFGPVDCGSETHRITYAAYVDEKPIISGAVKLASEWERPPAGSAIWELQLPKGTWFQELFVDGRRQPRARIPASGFIKARDLNQSRTEFGFGKGLTTCPDEASAVAIIRTYEWHEQLLPVSRIDASRGVVTLARSADNAIVPQSGGGVAGEFAIENVRAGLTGPGQWSLDRAKGTLSYWPPEGVDPRKADIRGATTRILFDLCGDPSRKQRIDNLHFRGLTFTQTGRIEKLEWGQYEGQAGLLDPGL